jgi:hypothetical protein
MRLGHTKKKLRRREGDVRADEGSRLTVWASDSRELFQPIGMTVLTRIMMTLSGLHPVPLTRTQANPTCLSNSIGLRYPIVECRRLEL